MSRSRNAPPVPPPHCSICQHKAPVFGKPSRFFSYKESELATNGFSQSSFLAEGGFESVHRGVLPEGQIVVVVEALEGLKKKADAQPDEIVSMEKLIGEAYSAIDKAVKVRALHKNTGARRKSRLARRKKAVEIHHGWYVPDTAAAAAPEAVTIAA